MAVNRLKILTILSECTGDDIWSLEHCRLRGIPEAWIADLSDCFESGFDTDANTIYVTDRVVNQYQGIRDVDIARRSALDLGLATDQLEQQAITRRHLVRLIKEAIEEM